MIDKDLVISAARSCLGVKFLHRGRNPAVGLDCSGLVLYAFTHGGWTPQAPELTLDSTYPWLADKTAMLTALQAECDEIALDELEVGDIVFMSNAETGEGRHMAIVTSVGEGGIYIIHTSYPLRRVVEHRVDAEWMAHIRTAFRAAPSLKV